MVGRIIGIEWSTATTARFTTMDVTITTEDGPKEFIHSTTVPATLAGRAAARGVLTAWMRMATADAWPIECDEDDIPW